MRRSQSQDQSLMKKLKNRLGSIFAYLYRKEDKKLQEPSVQEKSPPPSRERAKSQPRMAQKPKESLKLLPKKPQRMKKVPCRAHEFFKKIYIQNNPVTPYPPPRQDVWCLRKRLFPDDKELRITPVFEANENNTNSCNTNSSWERLVLSEEHLSQFSFADTAQKIN